MTDTPLTNHTSTPDPGVFGKIKHFFGIVWHGVALGAKDVVKAEQIVVNDAQKVEPELLMAAQVASLLNPTAGAAAKEIVTGGFTALGAITEAFENTEHTVSTVIAEAPEFTQVTVRTEALQQLLQLWQSYKTEIDTIKNAFVEQAKAGTPVPAALPASVTK